MRAFRFSGRAELKWAKPEFISPITERQWARATRFGPPPSSPSRARRTTSARSARRWPHTTCAPACAPYLRTHYVQAGVGHYGVFSGKRWQNQIYPIVRGVIPVSQ